MARKLNTEEAQDFQELLAESEVSGHTDFETLAARLRQKSQEKLELSPALGFWFGEDKFSLPGS